MCSAPMHQNIKHLSCSHSPVTSPVRAVAKYCDECISLSVCLSVRQDISLELHMRSLPNFLCMFPTAMARSSSGALMIGGIAYRQKGVMAPFTMHCNTIAASKVVPLHDGPFIAAGGWWEHTARQTESIIPSLMSLMSLQMGSARKGVTGVHSAG